VNKFKNFYTTEEISEYIQKKWKNKFLNNKNNSINLDDQYKFDHLKKVFFENKKIITLHVRQKGFYSLEDDNAQARNSNLISILEVLNSINSSFVYILMGGSNVPKNINKFKNIFNYAHSKLKSPINDALLIKYCDAHIGTTSGITHLTLNSNQPTLLINWYPFDYHFKNQSAVIVPKLLKKNNTIFSIKDYNKILPNILFDGISRLRDLNITYRDNTQDELFFAMKRFIKSLDNCDWINYGRKYLIEVKNFEFHQIDKNINKEVLDVRRKIYFDPYFVKKNTGFL
jgi:putative glycosyltransferase (TIGR04372 family)